MSPASLRDSQPTRLPLQLLCLVTSLHPRSCGTPYQNPLQGRRAEPHRNFVRAVLCARVAYFIDVTHVAPTDTDGVRIGAVVGHRGDHYSVAVDVGVGRGCPVPGEIHRMLALHSAPMRAERDRTRCRCRCRRYRRRRCGSRSRCRRRSRRRCRWRTGLRAVSAAGVQSVPVNINPPKRSFRCRSRRLCERIEHRPR